MWAALEIMSWVESFGAMDADGRRVFSGWHEERGARPSVMASKIANLVTPEKVFGIAYIPFWRKNAEKQVI